MRPIYKTGRAQRPLPDLPVTGQVAEILTPTYPHSLEDLYNLAAECNPIDISIRALRDGIFEEGWAWEPNFAAKCTNKKCGAEYDDASDRDECEKCGEATRAPDDAQTQAADEFFLNVDPDNDSTLDEVARAFERHLDIADDAYLIRSRDYELTEDNEIKSFSLAALYVGDPRRMRPIMDPETGRRGGLYTVCLACRDSDEYEPQDYTDDHCRECGGTTLYDVWYVDTEGTGGRSMGSYGGGATAYYIRGEVTRAQKYTPDPAFGTSPIVSVWQMARTLLLMENYNRSFYEWQKTPRGILVFKGKNIESVRSATKDIEAQTRSHGGATTPKLIVDSDAAGDPVKYIELSRPPADLGFGETRDEYYRRIGATFGVAPVYHGNVDAVGLQNQGPTQLVVTDAAIHKGQRVYNEIVFPPILDDLGVTDWRLVLRHSSKDEERSDAELDLLKTQVALSRSQIGFKPTHLDSEGEYQYPDEPTEEDPFGGFGGFGGGGFGGGGFGQAGGSWADGDAST